jgi:integrase
MASLQARHSRSCALGRPWTTYAEAVKGCTCTPLFHVVHRHNGKLQREPVGHNRKEAQRALDARRGDIARRTYRVLEDIPFDEWADRWLAGFSGKENSRRVYATTVAYAKDAFGRTKVRDLVASDVRRLLDHIKEETARRSKDPKNPRQVSPATLAKHLRQASACFEAAVAEGYASENPCKRLHKTARPRVTKSRPAYFTDVELARLLPELSSRLVYSTLIRAAVMTGMRFGELAALEWSDVDLLNREVHVRKTYTDGVGVTAPKSNETRTVDLTPQAAALFEQWFAQSGDDGLVFEREEGGHVSDDHVRRQVLYKAMQRAGIPRVGEHGRNRDLHSLRHSFARIALENGAEITWVQRQLGHSSITLTVDTYGHWSRTAEKAAAEKLAAVFPV